MPIKYIPPTPVDLATLKDELQLTGKQMADLAWLAGDQHWRKYTNPNPDNQRPMSAQMLFVMMAQLELDSATIERVLNRMRKAGATITLDAQ
ncbi:XRE family transcriptional regulator [Pararobbsia silviterrae]|uniref:XRE family transcriptional regulator n=1 Tax=Pararobbsia silviterrae TaxID=1792498 RepID=A0A494Y8D0_9BURK|nr:XRE family transcriptional regulator [Pararobbsia silviterrae]RKP58636.1 XRE family transcriptional regulator [Pararobbsia silviterrae]